MVVLMKRFCRLPGRLVSAPRLQSPRFRYSPHPEHGHEAKLVAIMRARRFLETSDTADSTVQMWVLRAIKETCSIEAGSNYGA